MQIKHRSDLALVLAAVIVLFIMLFFPHAIPMLWAMSLGSIQ